MIFLVLYKRKMENEKWSDGAVTPICAKRTANIEERTALPWMLLFKSAKTIIAAHENEPRLAA